MDVQETKSVGSYACTLIPSECSIPKCDGATPGCFTLAGTQLDFDVQGGPIYNRDEMPLSFEKISD